MEYLKTFEEFVNEDFLNEGVINSNTKIYITMYDKNTKFDSDGIHKDPSADISLYSITVNELSSILKINSKIIINSIDDSSESVYWVEEFYDFDQSKSKQIEKELISKGKFIEAGKGSFDSYYGTLKLNNKEIKGNILQFRKVN